jgi:hypothetical protein
MFNNALTVPRANRASHRSALKVISHAATLALGAEVVRDAVPREPVSVKFEQTEASAEG